MSGTGLFASSVLTKTRAIRLEWSASRLELAPRAEVFELGRQRRSVIELETRFLRHVEDSEGFPGLLHQNPSLDEENQYYDSNNYFATDEVRLNGADNPSEESVNERSVKSSSEESSDTVSLALGATSLEQSYNLNENTTTDHKPTLDTVKDDPDSLDLDGSKPKEAKQLYQHNLADKEKVIGPDHTSTLVTINNLGNVYRYQGRVTSL